MTQEPKCRSCGKPWPERYFIWYDLKASEPVCQECSAMYKQASNG